MKALAPILPVSDFRNKPKDVFAKLEESPIVLTLRGRPRAVLVDYDAYSEIVAREQALEVARDAFDALLLQRAQETSTGYRPFSELLQQYEELFGEKLDLPSFENKDKESEE